MAKRVAVPDEETIEKNGEVIKGKKKRSVCCTCCLIMLIFMAVIFVGAFVAGWILGDKFTKEYFDMSLTDTLGVVNDLYWTDDSDVVKRPYSKKDLNGFYSEIKRNILLKDSAEVDFDSALDSAIKKYLGMEQNSAQALNADDGDASGNGGETGNGGDGKKESDSQITDIFVNMIVEVLDRDNIDIERLNKYNADDPSTDEYIFNLNDKQLAAFINSVLKSVLRNAEKTESLSEISQTIKLDKAVSLKQIRFTAKEQKNADGKKEVKASSADVTIWIGLQDCANQAIHKLLRDEGYGWAGGLVGWLGDVFLPENVYITLSIPLYGEDNKADFRINDMDAGERKRAKKLMNGIIKLAMGNDSKSIDEVLEDLTEKMRPMLEKATEKMNFTNAGKGTISMDLLDTVAKMASDGKGEGEALTKADFLYVLQALLSDKTEQLTKLQPYRYDNWYMVDGEIKYLETGDPDKKVDYEKQLIEQIEQKYAIDLGENKSLTDVLKMFGISLDGSSDGDGTASDDLLEKLSKERFNALLDQPLNDIKLCITDRMLGATFAGQMSTLLKDNEQLEKLNITLEALTFVQKSDPEKSNHLYALLAVVIDLKDMLGSLTEDKDGLMGKLVSGLLPDDILLTVTVDITRDHSVTKDKAEFVINSCGNTDRVLATLEKFVPDIKLESMSNQISDMLNDMLTKMEDTLDIELAASTYNFNNDGYWLGTGEAASIVMPDIFTAVTDMALTKEGETESVVTPEQLQHVIRDLNNPANITPTQPNGYGAFIAQVFDKYYLEEPDPEHPVEDFDALTAYMSEFKTDMLRVNGTDGVAHDTRLMSALKPTMNEDELLALLQDNMGDKEAIESYSIVKVGIGDNTLSVTLSIELKNLLTDAEQVQKLINASELYATATFHTDQITGDGTDGNPYGYGVSLAVNVKRQGENTVMDSDTYNAMLNIVKFFADDFNIENQVKEFGVILYEQMQSLNTSIGGSAEHSFFTFTERGLELTDFFTFLALKMEPELLDDYTNVDIRATLQGLYSYDEEAPNDYNFKVSDITFNPPSEKGSKQWDEDDVKDVYGNTHLDVDFNGFIKEGVEQMAEKDAVTVEQTMILAKGDNRKKVKDLRDWLNAKLKLDEEDDVDANSDYLVMTFSMAMGDFVGGDGEGTNDAKQLFPTKIYATVVYKYDSTAAAGSKFSVVGGISDVAPVLVFNNMDSTQYEIMVRLMGANPTDADTGATDDKKVNMKSIAKKGAEVLNGMSHYEITIPGTGNKVELNTTITFSATGIDEGGNDEPGMGKIFISKPSYTGGLV